MLMILIPDPLRRAVGYSHADSGESSFELSFRSVRQLMFCHPASASMSSAAIDRISGTCR
jgi:hypothetical protein